MNILVTVATGQLGNEMRVLSAEISNTLTFYRCAGTGYM